MDIKYYVIGILCILAVILGIIALQPSSINYSGDDNTQYLGQQEFAKFSPTPYIIDGDTVYINDDNAYISATPHTAMGWVTINFTSKRYSGDVDFLIGLNTGEWKISNPQINPHIEQVEKSYTCPYEFNYTLNPKHFWCYYENVFDGEEGTSIVFEHDFESGDLESKTAYWTENEIVWDDLQKDYDVIERHIFNMTRWYMLSDNSINEDQRYYFRFKLSPKVFNAGATKYWIVFKPSDETFEEAIDNNHLYALDPWSSGLNASIKFLYKFDESTGTDVPDYFGVYDGVHIHGENEDWGTGKINNGMDLDGADEYVNVTGSIDLIKAMNQSTFCIWINPDAVDQSRLLHKDHTTYGSDPYTIYSASIGSNGDGSICLEETGGTGKKTTCTGSGIVSTGSWQHLCYVTHANGDVDLYYNGANQSTSINNNPSLPLSSTSIYPVVIGLRALPSPVQFYDGDVDQAVLWYDDKSTAEIEELYNSGNGLAYASVPTVDIVYPVHEEVYSVSVSQLNYTVDSGEACWYSANNGTSNSSSVTAGQNFSISSDPAWNNFTVYCNNSDGEEGNDYVAFYVNKSVGTDLVSPANAYTTANTYVVFNYTSTTLNTNLTNVTLYVWHDNGTLFDSNYSDLSGTDDVSTQVNLSGFIEDGYIWNVKTCGLEVSCNFDSSNRTFEMDFTPPNVDNDTLISLTANALPKDQVWEYDAVDPNGNLDSCYYNSTQNTSYIEVTCNSPITTTWYTEGNKTIQYCANDSVGWETCASTTIGIVYYNYTYYTDPNPTSEGQTVTFQLYVNMTDIPDTTAILQLNNTNYSDLSIDASDDYFLFTQEVTIPDGLGSTSGTNVSYRWFFETLGYGEEATDPANLTIYSVEIDNCTEYTKQILNFTLKDEETNTVIVPPTVNGSTIEIDLQIIARDNESLHWDYSKLWEEDADGTVIVCVDANSLTNSEYRLDFTVGFDADGYAREFYYLDNGTLDEDLQYNSLTDGNITLYDLLLDDSTTFLFRFYDDEGLEVPNSIVHTFRKYIGAGEFREVERSKEDDNGETHVHLVEEDVIYYFKVSLDGEVLYTSSVYNAKCLSEPCQIELDQSGEFEGFETDFDLVNGSYTITDNSETRKVTMTYALNDPEYMNLTIMKYTNNPETLEVVGSQQSYATGGTLSVTVPQSAGNVTFLAVVYKNGEFIESQWVNFHESGRDYFGATGVFMALLLLIALVLMASSEGEGTIIFSIIALIVIGALKLVDLDYYSLIGFICAGIILAWKIAQRRKS